ERRNGPGGDLERQLGEAGDGDPAPGGELREGDVALRAGRRRRAETLRRHGGGRRHQRHDPRLAGRQGGDRPLLAEVRRIMGGPRGGARTGLEELLARRGRLRGRRLGLIATPASVTADLVHASLALRSSRAFRLAALFGPEHGIWANAQDLVEV